MANVKSLTGEIKIDSAAEITRSENKRHSSLKISCKYCLINRFFALYYKEFLIG